jgi:hypothetical protein
MMYWNMKNTKYAIIMIASIMVIVGTTLTPVLQQQANAAVQVRSQHMNQENLCYRTNTCRQSDVGQNTLGNDNQVTGFADQSDNLQQTPTPTVIPTPTPTPTPSPTTATLTVIKVVNGTTTATPANFTIQVTGNNPTPANFAGSSTGTDVTLSPGAFNVTETASPNFATSFSSECSGNITAGQHLTCTITNTAKTCEECFTSFLTQAQITAFLLREQVSSISAACTILNGGDVSEAALIGDITAIAGADVANQIIACLKAAGIVFA